MLEVLQYVTSSFWVFLGCTFFTLSFLAFIGWTINAILIGLHGHKCDNVNL